MKRKSGFTLAEVLITLGIIGVVAAMTIPSLINQTNGQQYKTGLKKIVSVLNQAITMNVALNETDFSLLTSAAAGVYTNTNTLPGVLYARLNVLSTTNTGAGVAQFTDTGVNQIMQLNDGMFVSIPVASNFCTTAAICTAYVDVNGAKNPNILSTATDDTSKSGLKDQFILNFYNQQVLPANAAAQYALFN